MLALNKRVTKVTRKKADAFMPSFLPKPDACICISVSADIFRPFTEKINRKSGKTVFIAPVFEFKQSTIVCMHPPVCHLSILSRRCNFQCFPHSRRFFPFRLSPLPNADKCRMQKKEPDGSFFTAMPNIMTHDWRGDDRYRTNTACAIGCFSA